MVDFEVKKAVQATAVLLARAPGGQMPYLQLLKLLYIADRESFRESLRPILGGTMVAMRFGPLHSEVYELVKGHLADAQGWERYIMLDEYVVELVDDPGDSELSDYEVALLERISETYRGYTEWDLVELTHSFEEWKRSFPDPKSHRSYPIHVADILDAVGLAGQKQAILDEMNSESHEQRSLQKLIAKTNR